MPGESIDKVDSMGTYKAQLESITSTAKIDNIIWNTFKEVPIDPLKGVGVFG